VIFAKNCGRTASHCPAALRATDVCLHVRNFVVKCRGLLRVKPMQSSGRCRSEVL